MMEMHRSIDRRDLRSPRSVTQKKLDLRRLQICKDLRKYIDGYYEEQFTELSVQIIKILR